MHAENTGMETYLSYAKQISLGQNSSLVFTYMYTGPCFEDFVQHGALFVVLTASQ